MVENGLKVGLGESSRKKKDLTEYCIVKHIHLIFSQATITFKHEIQLWKQWFAFCKSTNSTQRMSKVKSDFLMLLYGFLF